jgi:hypothetical protein
VGTLWEQISDTVHYVARSCLQVKPFRKTGSENGALAAFAAVAI